MIVQNHIGIHCEFICFYGNGLTLFLEVLCSDNIIAALCNVEINFYVCGVSYLLLDILSGVRSSCFVSKVWTSFIVRWS